MWQAFKTEFFHHPVVLLVSSCSGHINWSNLNKLFIANKEKKPRAQNWYRLINSALSGTIYTPQLQFWALIAEVLKASC